MAYERREGQGSLFPNRKKEPGSKQPDWRGDALVNGVLMEVAAWSKESAKGSFLSLSIKPKHPLHQAQAGAPRSRAQADRQDRKYAADRISSGPVSPRRSADMDDEIPFEMEWR